MIAESTKLCTTAETIVAKRRIKTMGLLNWERKRDKADSCFLASSWFGPVAFSRLRASSLERPLVRSVFRMFASVSGVRVQYSASFSFCNSSIFVYYPP